MKSNKSLSKDAQVNLAFSKIYKVQNQQCPKGGIDMYIKEYTWHYEECRRLWAGGEAVTVLAVGGNIQGSPDSE